jgi:hypothetical protein
MGRLPRVSQLQFSPAGETAGRRLAREFDVSYRLSDEPARLQSDLDTLFARHAARWNTASSAFAGERMAFHRAFAEHAQELGWLRLWIAESGDQPVAAWYGFRFAGVESYYQMGRDPSWDRSAAGGCCHRSRRKTREASPQAVRRLNRSIAVSMRTATRPRADIGEPSQLAGQSWCERLDPDAIVGRSGPVGAIAWSEIADETRSSGRGHR